MTDITTTSEIDVLNLFVHDRYDAGNLDERELAEALTAHILAALSGHLEDCPMDEWATLSALKVRTPGDTTLDRFVLGAHSERCHSWDHVKALWARAGLPDVIAKSLESLQRSSATWRLESGQLRRERPGRARSLHPNALPTLSDCDDYDGDD